MDPMPTIGIQANLQDAAALIVKTQSSIIAVLYMDGKLAGVLTTWDVSSDLLAQRYLLRLLRSQTNR
jgi:CBS domain-containing protein